MLNLKKHDNASNTHLHRFTWLTPLWAVLYLKPVMFVLRSVWQRDNCGEGACNDAPHIIRCYLGQVWGAPDIRHQVKLPSLLRQIPTFDRFKTSEFHAKSLDSSDWILIVEDDYSSSGLEWNEPVSRQELFLCWILWDSIFLFVKFI